MKHVTLQRIVLLLYCFWCPALVKNQYHPPQAQQCIFYNKNYNCRTACLAVGIETWTWRQNKRKTKAQAVFLKSVYLLLTVETEVLHLSICYGSYPFANRLKRLKRLNRLIELAHLLQLGSTPLREVVTVPE
jgi:hypothetical protein